MRVSRGKASVISDVTIDQDLDFLTLYQAKRLASPASGEALRKGNKDIANAEIADAANIAISKLVDDYLPQVLLTTQGDIIVRGASLPARLAKITTGQFLKATATTYEGAAIREIDDTLASDLLQHSNDTEKSTTSASYVKLKEILLTSPLTHVRVKFDWQSLAQNGYWRVYKNGAAIGTEKIGADTWTTESEDINLAASVGDLIQMYVHCNGTATSSVKNFRLHHDLAFGAHTNQDP